jgi:hypothetical protein
MARTERTFAGGLSRASEKRAWKEGSSHSEGAGKQHICRMMSRDEHSQASLQRAGRQPNRQAGSFPFAVVPALKTMLLQGRSAFVYARPISVRIWRCTQIALRSA